MSHILNNKQNYIDNIINLQDSSGCWNVEQSLYGPELNYYVPNYKSTLWTLVLLADLEAPIDDIRIIKPLKIITEHFWDNENGIFTIGKSHFPIPCLNGNMIYLLNYFDSKEDEKINRVLNFFNKYQRFDDGDFKTPRDFPYLGNKSCYGKHSCYWGIIKLFKGISFINRNKRNNDSKELLNNCTDFILKHSVCYSSHNKAEFINPIISKITFPNMYKSDFLEILWLLSREVIKSLEMDMAINLLKSKRKNTGNWELERQVKDLIIPITKKHLGNEIVTKRAKCVNYTPL